MRKNILVLTSSPRRGGNSDMLAMSFAKGAMEQGHEVSMVSVGHQQIGGCLACERCWKHHPLVGANAAHPTLCPRCAKVVQAIHL